MSFMRGSCAAAVLALGLVAGAGAGQVRVSVSSNQFTPASVSVKPGDHVVWVWVSGFHSVTSGTDGSSNGSGVFDSDIISGGKFSWKAGAVSVPYYCEPHWPDMTGNITVTAGASTSDFRITEVQFNVGAGLDLIEIGNLGPAAGNLGRYRISAANGVAVELPDNIAIASGGRVTIHTNTTGVNTATDFFVQTLPDLPASGSVALYVPNSVAPALTNTATIIDFVQWGASGQPNEATAAAATFWSTGDAIVGVAAGHSIERCSTSYGLGAWAEIATPNFGTNGNCSTPTGTTTWGRIKTLYR